MDKPSFDAVKPAENMRECEACHQILPIDRFARTGERSHYHACKECRRSQTPKRRNGASRYETINGELYRWCTQCQTMLPIAQFYVREQNHKTYHSPQCRVCTAARSMAYHRKQRKAYLATPEGQIEQEHKRRIHEARSQEKARPKQRRGKSYDTVVDGVLSRHCSCCEQVLPVTAFPASKSGKVYPTCRVCRAEKHSQWRATHGPVLARKAAKWYAAHREQQRTKMAEFYRKNHTMLRAAAKARHRRRLASDPIYRLTHTLRHRINEYIRHRQTRKRFHTHEMLGCTAAELVTYLETRFQPGMTWENRGRAVKHGEPVWHIDHIRPLASFDLTDPAQQLQAFHYTNLQPLWATENLAKGDRLDWTPTHA